MYRIELPIELPFDVDQDNLSLHIDLCVKNSNRQEFIISGGAIHWAANQSKCWEVGEEGTADGTRIQLKDCQ